jgi:hypothetical protein
MKRTIAVCTIGLLFIYSSVYSQEKMELDIGAGFFEALSLKAKFGNNIQVGIGQGFVGKYAFHSCLELYYQRGRIRNPDRKIPFYIMGGVGSTFLSTGYQNHITTIYPRVGWSIRFSQRTGLNLDAGPCLFRTKDTDDSFNWSFVPSGSIHFFVKVL